MLRTRRLLSIVQGNPSGADSWLPASCACDGSNLLGSVEPSVHVESSTNVGSLVSLVSGLVGFSELGGATLRGHLCSRERRSGLELEAGALAADVKGLAVTCVGIAPNQRKRA